MDKIILEELDIRGVCGSIKLIIYNNHGDKQFYLKMINVISNRIVFKIFLGEFEKKGRMFLTFQSPVQ